MFKESVFSPPQTRNSFNTLLLNYLNTQFPGVDMALFNQAQFYFDAVWTAALGLNATLSKLY